MGNCTKSGIPAGTSLLNYFLLKNIHRIAPRRCPLQRKDSLTHLAIVTAVFISVLNLLIIPGFGEEPDANKEWRNPDLHIDLYPAVSADRDLPVRFAGDAPALADTFLLPSF